jgi:DNA-binding transcriptional LysR family regulator
VVLCVAEHLGFAPAAAALNMSASAVSHAVRTVEDRLGEPLFARTTRSVSLTAAGTRFVASVRPALEDIEKTIEGLHADRGEVTGVLRINASRVAASIALTPILERLAQKHPRLVVEVHINDAFVDIVHQGFDAGIRLGDAVQQDMVSVRLTPPLRALMVAAPRYLASRPAPVQISELAEHNCIGFRLLASGALYDWDLQEESRAVTFKTRGSAVVTDATYARDLALAGVGIAYIFEPLVRADIQAQRLVQVLPQAVVQEPGLFLYFAQRAALAPKLRAFIDVAREVQASANAPSSAHSSSRA